MGPFALLTLLVHLQPFRCNLNWAFFDFRILQRAVNMANNVTLLTTPTMSSPQYGDRAARRPHILRSICVHSVGTLADDCSLFMAPLYQQPMRHQMRPFRRSPTACPKFERGNFRPTVCRVREHGDGGWIHLLARP